MRASHKKVIALINTPNRNSKSIIPETKHLIVAIFYDTVKVERNDYKQHQNFVYLNVNNGLLSHIKSNPVDISVLKINRPP